MGDTAYTPADGLTAISNSDMIASDADCCCEEEPPVCYTPCSDCPDGCGPPCFYAEYSQSGYVYEAVGVFVYLSSCTWGINNMEWVGETVPSTTLLYDGIDWYWKWAEFEKEDVSISGDFTCINGGTIRITFVDESWSEIAFTPCTAYNDCPPA